MLGRIGWFQRVVPRIDRRCGTARGLADDEPILRNVKLIVYFKERKKLVNTLINKFALAASLVLSAGAASAATITVAPGGNFTASGLVSFRLTGGSSGFTGSCAVILRGSLNPSNASVTVTEATFDAPCGTINGNPVGASLAVPFSANTTSMASDGAFTYPVRMSGTLFQASGPGPLWIANCNSALSPPISLKWKTNGLPGASSTSLSTGGWEWFGNTATGTSCEIMFDLALVPFQTFT